MSPFKETMKLLKIYKHIRIKQYTRIYQPKHCDIALLININ